MARPRLLDLFCCAGMASDGYTLAGFDVTGVDIAPQPDYPYTFVQGDALDYLAAHGHEYQAIHASPPCQQFTRAAPLRKAQGGTSRFGDLLTPTLAALRGVQVPWVVENVEGAPMPGYAIMLCGSSFGLGVRRHRLFTSNCMLLAPQCQHRQQGRPWGVYHVPADEVPDGGRTARDAAHGAQVMGVTRRIPWDRLKEGLPPAYTHHIGEQLLQAVHVG